MIFVACVLLPAPYFLHDQVQFFFLFFMVALSDFDFSLCICLSHGGSLWFTRPGAVTGAEEEVFL